MTPVDIVIIAVIVLCVGGASLYIYKAKKSGARCIGCSAGGCACSAGDDCACGCGCR